MFTGLVEEKGRVKAIVPTDRAIQLTIEAEKVLSDIVMGASISVNGICLSVVDFDSTSFKADVMHETLEKTSLKSISEGSEVNLERALKADGRFGGHIVSGHIDGTGVIKSIEQDGIATWYTIRTSPEIMRYIVYKGSITVDGISLTVARVSEEEGTFSVSIIPHTLEVTTLGNNVVGDTVNLENDVVGKYIEKFTLKEEGK